MLHFYIVIGCILASLVGCATSQPEVFELPQGEIITCLRYSQQECGMKLAQCGAEHSVDFECLSGVKYVGLEKGVPK